MPVRSISFAWDELAIVKQLPLITAKPLVFCCNIGPDDMEKGTNALATKFTEYVNEKYPQIPVVALSALLENEIVMARTAGGEESAQEIMQLYGLEESKLDQLLEHCSDILNL